MVRRTWIQVLVLDLELGVLQIMRNHFEIERMTGGSTTSTRIYCPPNRAIAITTLVSRKLAGHARMASVLL